MNELYSIMEECLQCHYEVKAIITLLNTLEGSYSEEEKPELKSRVCVTKTYLEAIQERMREIINRIDYYIVEEVKK